DSAEGSGSKEGAGFGKTQYKDIGGHGVLPSERLRRQEEQAQDRAAGGRYDRSRGSSCYHDSPRRIQAWREAAAAASGERRYRLHGSDIFQCQISEKRLQARRIISLLR